MFSCYKEWDDVNRTHPAKAKAEGLRTVTVPLVLFCDDTSGNKSKKWNKFIEWNLTIAGKLLMVHNGTVGKSEVVLGA